MTNDQVFELFGDLLFVLIGLELMHTVKIYQGVAVIGLALLIVSLAASYWFLGRRTTGTKA